MYRDRLARKPLPRQGENEQVELARTFRRVFSGAEGMMVLDYICETLCNVDAPVTTADPMVIVDFNARRNVGVTIAQLVLSPIDEVKTPEVVT